MAFPENGAGGCLLPSCPFPLIFPIFLPHSLSNSFPPFPSTFPFPFPFPYLLSLSLSLPLYPFSFPIRFSFLSAFPSLPPFPFIFLFYLFLPLFSSGSPFPSSFPSIQASRSDTPICCFKSAHAANSAMDLIGAVKPHEK